MEILCPSGHRLQVTADQAGQKVRCPTCQQVFVVPEQRTATPPQVVSDPEPIVAESSSKSVRPAARRGFAPSLDFFTQARTIGQPLLMAGLVLVLFARGCDALGNRQVSRLDSKAKLAQLQFDEEALRKKTALEDQIEDVRTQKKENANSEILELNKKLDALQKDTTNKRQTLQHGEWHDLQTDATFAAAKNTIWAYWREALFVLGTIVLSIGLLVVGFNGQGAERWICLTILAIIIFSIYVGGTGWGGRT